MAWRIEFHPDALDELAKLDKEIQRRILKFLHGRITDSKDPRASGKVIRKDKKGLWRYRVGGYRIICAIRDEIMVVLIVRIGHWRSVYD